MRGRIFIALKSHVSREDRYCGSGRLTHRETPLQIKWPHPWICTNPKDIPPDDVDDEILGKMVKEADAMYQWQLKFLKR